MLHENTVDYILGEFSKQHKLNEKISKFATNTDEAFQVVAKALIKVKKFDNLSVIFAMLCIGYGCYNMKKLTKLEKELKELRKMKGE